MCEIDPPNVEEPSVEEVYSWLQYADDIANCNPHAVYQEERAYLDGLFQRFPDNTDNFDNVMIKISTLNSLFRTNASPENLFTYAQTISSAEIEFDNQLGDIQLVSYVCDAAVQAGADRLYSLATKYCHFHHPEIYPIYDSNVDEALWHFKQKQWLTTTHFKRRNDLKNYNTFYNVLQDLINILDNGFDFITIDKYLFLVGRKLWKDKRRKNKVVGD